MKKLLLIALSTSLAMGANAADDKKFYAGAAGSAWKMSDDSTGSANFNLSALEGAFGYEALPWLAVEARVGFGVGRQTEDIGWSGYSLTELSAPTTEDPDAKEPGVRYTRLESPVKAELNYYASFYLKPQIKNDTAIFYGLIGYTVFDSEFSVAPSTLTQSEYAGEIDKPDEWIYRNGASSINSDSAGEYSESEGSFSMGVGVGFYFKEHYVFNIEYKNLIQSLPVGDSDTTLRTNGVTLGINYSF